MHTELVAAMDQCRARLGESRTDFLIMSVADRLELLGQQLETEWLRAPDRVRRAVVRAAGQAAMDAAASVLNEAGPSYCATTQGGEMSDAEVRRLAEEILSAAVSRAREMMGATRRGRRKTISGPKKSAGCDLI
jgi:hypothetical protein